MSQSRKGTSAILWRRTLTTMATLWFCLVATVRIIVCLRGGTGLVEMVVEKVDVTVLRVAVRVTITIGVAIHVAVLVSVAEPLLEEGGNIADYSAELLVTVCLCCPETTSDMSADKGHGYGV